jgi:endonuclease YncB( thermonuclease family)
MIRAVVVGCSLAVAACGPVGDTTTGPATAPPEAQPATVLTVLDGDSLILDLGGEEREARLIGVNAPERDECWGSEARAGLVGLVEGADVTVSTDVEATDRYDRLLVYVWSADGHLVNADLAARGDVIARAFPPNTARQVVIDRAGEAAQSGGAGLWGGCASRITGVELVDVNADPPGPDEDVLIDEWVSFRATDDTDLSSWTLRDGSTVNRYVLPEGTRLAAGDVITIRTGCGVDTTTDLHWCSDTPVWNNDGDDVILMDADGRFVVAEAYGG